MQTPQRADHQIVLQLVLLKAQADLADSLAVLGDAEVKAQKAKVDAARIRVEIATTKATSSRSNRSRSERLVVKEPPASPPRGEDDVLNDLSITGLRDIREDLSSLMGRSLMLDPVFEEPEED